MNPMSSEEGLATEATVGMEKDRSAARLDVGNRANDKTK
jgi:hypothetical protein